MSSQTMKKPRSLDASWAEVLEEEFEKPYMQELSSFLQKERAADWPIFPPQHEVFSAFNYTPFDKVKVLIMGQDPYHGPGQAHGLAFSVRKGVRTPPSLVNMYKELQSDLGIPPASHGCLESWAKQGVLLLNASLTVRQGQANSHQTAGWGRFTDAVVEKLCQREDPLIFVLWGRSARNKCESVLNVYKNQRHRILTAAHPSPLSAHNGFFGCQHFSKINKILKLWDREEINWKLPND